MYPKYDPDIFADNYNPAYLDNIYDAPKKVLPVLS